MRIFLKLTGFVLLALLVQVAIESGTVFYHTSDCGPFTRPMPAERARIDRENERFAHLTPVSRWVLGETLNMPWDDLGPGSGRAVPCAPAARPKCHAPPCQATDPADLCCD